MFFFVQRNGYVREMGQRIAAWEEKHELYSVGRNGISIGIYG